MDTTINSRRCEQEHAEFKQLPMLANNKQPLPHPKKQINKQTKKTKNSLCFQSLTSYALMLRLYMATAECLANFACKRSD